MRTHSVYPPLEEMYFGWLCHNVTPALVPGQDPIKYDNLFHVLYETEFVFLLSGDDNRAEDGKELRAEFLIAGDFPDDIEWRTLLPASVFEVILAFARKCEFNSDMSHVEWFWEMLNNLRLDQATDDSGIPQQEILDILEYFMWRQYQSDGDGGLFPLEHPHRNQTEIEIWDQFSDYMVDKNRLPA